MLLELLMLSKIIHLGKVIIILWKGILLEKNLMNGPRLEARSLALASRGPIGIPPDSNSIYRIWTAGPIGIPPDSNSINRIWTAGHQKIISTKSILPPSDGSEIITNNVCYDRRSKLGVFEYLHKKSLEKYLKTTKSNLVPEGRLNWELCSQVLLKN